MLTSRAALITIRTFLKSAYFMDVNRIVCPSKLFCPSKVFLLHGRNKQASVPKLPYHDGLYMYICNIKLISNPILAIATADACVKCGCLTTLQIMDMNLKF